MRNLFVFFTLCIILISFTGCNSLWDFDDDDSTSAIVSTKAPANANSLNNVTLSINPTISFSGNSFTYVNNVSDHSSFPTTGGVTLTGSFTYTPDATNTSSASLFLDFSGTTEDILLVLSNFNGTGSSITSFTAAYKTYNFQVTVTGGTLVPAPSTNTTTNTGTTTSGTTATIPESIKGKNLTLTLDTLSNTAPASFPYKKGDTEQFTFSSSSMLFVGKTSPQNELGLPSTYTGSSEYIWYDKTNSYYVALSTKSDGSFNEINIYSKPIGGIFYGQFVQK